MIIRNNIPPNGAFWRFLNHQLRIIFNERKKFKYYFQITYPSYGAFGELTFGELLKKRKTIQSVTVNTIMVFVNNDEEIEYLGKLILGKYSIKTHANVKGTDLYKCFPDSDYDNWIKINELNNTIEITLN